MASLYWNGVEMDTVYFNSVEMEKIYFNGVLVYETSNPLTQPTINNPSYNFKTKKISYTVTNNDTFTVNLYANLSQSSGAIPSTSRGTLAGSTTSALFSDSTVSSGVYVVAQTRQTGYDDSPIDEVYVA